MKYTRMLYETVEPGIVKVTMNRPEKRNAEDALMLEEMQEAFVEADIDEDVRVIILAGAGKDFSSGHDMSGKGEKDGIGYVECAVGLRNSRGGQTASGRATVVLPKRGQNLPLVWEAEE